MQLAMVVSSMEHVRIRKTAKIVWLTKLDLPKVMPDNQKGRKLQLFDRGGGGTHDRARRWEVFKSTRSERSERTLIKMYSKGLDKCIDR